MFPTWIPHTQQPQMAKSHDMLKTCQSQRIHTAILPGDPMQMERVSAPIVDPVVVPAPGPVPVHSVVCDSAALLYPSFLVIDPSPARLSLIGRLVCLHPGGSHRRGRGRGIDSTSSDDRQYSQPQDDQDCAWNHRWCSWLMAIRVSSAPVSCAITGKTRQKSCRVTPYRACGRSSGTGRMTHIETL